MKAAGNLLLLAGSGALAALAFPKIGCWPLILVGLVPLFVALDRPVSPPASSGFAWGVGYFGGLLHWLYGFFRHYGGLGPVLSVATLGILVGYLAVYPGLFAHLGARTGGLRAPSAPLVLPAVWVALEWVRGHALSGFPWGLTGYPLSPCTSLIQIASLTGVYGLSFFVLLVNLTLAVWFAERRAGGPNPKRLTGAVALISVGLLAWGRWNSASPGEGGPSIRVGVIQANIPQDEKWDAQSAEAILRRHEEYTRSAAERGAVVVLWPESSSPFPLSHPSAGPAGGRVTSNQDYRERLTQLARGTRASILFGTVDYRETPSGPRPVNAAALVGPDGSFGEYVPLGRLLGFVNRFVEGTIGDFIPGDRAVVVRADGARVGTAICYEMIFPELVRRFPRRGAEILANLTNDAWFGTSSGPYQHFQMTTLRAVENHRYLIRAANTGISAVVDPYGRVVAASKLGQARILVADVVPRTDLTFYARHGDVFAILCVILAAGSALTTWSTRPRFLAGGAPGHE
jgi:apolipoprotein N-acyltransferase